MGKKEERRKAALEEFVKTLSPDAREVYLASSPAWQAGGPPPNVEDKIGMEPKNLFDELKALVGEETAEALWSAGGPVTDIENYVNMCTKTPRKKIDISTRITWDQYGMQLATTAALRADCRRRQVGAVLMGEDHSIISMGYNGGPSKGKSCLEGQCPRGLLSKEELPGNSAYDTGGGTCVALHAEWNVLLRTSWDQFEGSTLYVTHKPCHICSVLISGTRIRRVVAPGYDWVAYL